MLYVDSRKSLEGRREKKLLFYRVPLKTLGNNITLPSVNKKHLPNVKKKHTTYLVFAECL